MNIIQHIIRHIVLKLDPLESQVNDTCDLHISLNFIIYNKEGKDLNKFQSLDIMVLKNIFYSDKKKKKYFNLFCRAQKIHRCLCKIARLWRWKKALLYPKTEDLIGNPLSSFSNHLKITILQENTKYIFRISDLLNIWMKSLTYTSGMTPRPKMPCNPYLGLTFHKHHLYQIYFHVRFYTSFDIPMYLSQFFKHKFNIRNFRTNMYTLLRDDAITSHLSDSAIPDLYFDILNMINGNQKIFNNKKIRNDLQLKDQIKVVKLLKSLLTFYLFGILSCNPFVKKKQWYYFKSGVKKFLRQHPTFGRFIRRTRCLCLTTDLNYLAIRGEDWCIRSEDSESDSDVEMMPVEAPIILPVH